MYYYDIKIPYHELKYCPYCGSEVEKSSYYQEEDDIHYRGNVNVVKCNKCNKTLYHK